MDCFGGAYAFHVSSASQWEYSILQHDCSDPRPYDFQPFQLNWPSIITLMNNASAGVATGGKYQINMAVDSFPAYYDADTLKPLNGVSILDLLGGLFTRSSSC